MSVLKRKWGVALAVVGGLCLSAVAPAKADGWYIRGGYSSCRPYGSYYVRPVYVAPRYCPPRPVVYYERPIVCYERPTYYVRPAPVYVCPPSYGGYYYGGGYSRYDGYGRGYSFGGSYYDNGYRGGSFYFDYRR